jgi:ligand-binding sensor domain-containing protein
MRQVLLAVLVVVVSVVPAFGQPKGDGADKTVQRLAPPLGCDRLTIANGLPNSNMRAIVQDKRGFIWFGTEDGLVRYDGTRMRVYRPLEKDPSSISSGYITALQLDASGKLWIGTAENGVNLYDSNTDRFTRYTQTKETKGGLSSEGITAIARDPKDRVWFAMSGGGLNRFEPGSGTFTEYLQKPLDATITKLAADKAGNLWLGTAGEGLIRWNPDDGSTAQFQPKPGDQLGMVAAPITAVLASSKGLIWIGSDGEGLLALDPKSATLTKYRHVATDPQSISDDHITVLFEDQKGVLWVGTPNGLNKMDPSGKTFLRYQHDPEDPNDPTKLSFPAVESMYQDTGGVMWVGGFTVGVCKFDEFHQQLGHYRTRTHANSFFEDADGTLWVGTYNGLYKFEWGAQRVTTYHNLGKNLGNDEPASLQSVWITAIHRDRRGTLWMALQRNGLIAFDPKTESYRRYLPDEENANGLPVDTIWDIWEDERGHLWLASWGGGLLRMDPQLETFTAFTTDAADESSGLTSNHLYTLYPDPSDKKVLWLGTAKGGLVKFDITANSATSFRHNPDKPDTLSSDDILTVHRDGGTIWVGTFGAGLNKLDLASGKVERFTTGNSKITNNTVFGILPDADGKLWMSTNGGGLVSYDPKAKTFQAYDVSDGIQNSEFSQGSFMRGKAGKLFFGGAGGFNAFDPRGITRDSYVPQVAMTAFKVFNQEVKLDRPIWTLPPLEVSYSDSFEIEFSALGYAAPEKNRYAYKLEGFDDKFIETDRPYATYTKLDGGNYTLRVRAANQHGVWKEDTIALKLRVTPPIWRTWPAYGIYLLLLAGAAYLVIRLQRQRVQRAEREGRLAVVERDLELTGAVQVGFLPEHNEINTAQLRLYGLYRPADACSGDWWWYETMGGKHLVIVGDVTGHGPGPAMVTAAVATAFRVLIEDGLNDINIGLERLNREVLRVSKGKYHMTMAVLELEETTGHWIFHSAGAPPMLSLNNNGKHRVHFCPGAPLGTEIGFETGRVEGRLQPNERLLLYTDGIPEILLPNGNVMGMRRFAQQYEMTRGQRLRDAAASILQHADQTRGNQRQTDDWTFAILEWG